MSLMDRRSDSGRLEVFEDDDPHTRIMTEINLRAKQRMPDDSRDWSRNPSYTNMSLPYEIVCSNRYKASVKAYEAQFQREIRKHLQQQSSGYDEFILTRQLAYTSLWPPLHSRREWEFSRRTIFSMNRKNRLRLTYLMETNII